MSGTQSTQPLAGDPVVQPLRAVPSSRPRLPHPVSSFVGRARELAAVERLLGESRCVTLTGPGGCGKTRLALAVATALAPRFDDGACLVELAALGDPALVPQAVAAALGLREGPRRSPRDALLDQLRSKQLLLVLDNCEHLIEACAALCHTLLLACPDLHMLATSREPLRIAGEHVWPVPPLSLPDLAGEASPPERLMESDAVRLFAARAAAVAPGFALSAATAPAVVRICARLEGIPLAIELAAARVRMLSVDEIASRLDDCFRLLNDGDRDAPARHQTLRAAIDWSYELLDEPERRLFRRLAVFAGGCTLAAAEAVCAAEDAAARDVFPLLARLVDKSLVMAVARAGETRYRMLETVRQYALERLAAAGEVESLARRHALHMLRFTEEASPQLASGGRGIWLERLDAEHDNLRTGLEWVRTHGEAERGLRIAAALEWFWYFRGQLTEGREWLRSLLAQADEAVPQDVRARALYVAGAAAWVQGDYSAAGDLLRRSLELWRSLDDPRGLAYALTLSGLVAELRADSAAARALQEESLVRFRAAGDRWGLALALYWQADTTRMRRDHPAARRLFTESLALFRELGDAWGIGLDLQGLAAVAYRLGAFDEAQARLEEALAVRRSAGDNWLIAQSLSTLGVVLHRVGEMERAQEHFREALALYRGLGDGLGVAFALRGLGLIAREQHAYDDAATLLRESLRQAAAQGRIGRVAQCLADLAAVALAQGAPLRAARLRGAAERLHEEDRAAEPLTQGLPVPEGNAKEDTGAIQAAYTEGRLWSLDRAIEYALAEPEPPASPVAVQPPASSQTRDRRQSETLLRVVGLGPVRVYLGDRELTSADWSYVRVRDLFLYLLCHGPRTKAQIALAFWPDALPTQVRGNFHDALHHLRRALGRPDWITFERGMYAFNRTLDYAFDVERFEALLAQARDLRPAAPEAAARALEEAVALYGGDFLENVMSVDWHLARREELRRGFLAALDTLGELHVAAGRYPAAASVYRRIIAADRYQEAAYRHLMRVYALLGERGQALRQYQELAGWLRDEVGVAPAPETLQLFEALRRGGE